MKKIIVILMAILPYAVFSQGIKFEEGQSWAQIVKKAKKENKFIFVDCYATWCKPCKYMDNEVYPLGKVGAAFNNKFISIKMQLDTTKRDNAVIKAAYADAAFISEKYKITAYPTLLFIRPDNGEVAFKALGAKGADDLVAYINLKTDSYKKYAQAFDNYKKGNGTPEEMIIVARTYAENGNYELAGPVVKDYLSKVRDDQLLTKENIKFLFDFRPFIGKKGFDLFYNNTDAVDKIMESNDFTLMIVGDLISREIINPAVEEAKKSGKSPDWDALASIIQKKYTAYYAERVIIDARSQWGYRNKNWPEYTKHLVLFVEKYRFPATSNDGFTLNNCAFEIFQYSDNREELKKALTWSTRAMLVSPLGYAIDTYANLLYKLGRKPEAIAWEIIAGKVEPDEKSFGETVKKMQSGEPTWPSK